MDAKSPHSMRGNKHTNRKRPPDPPNLADAKGGRQGINKQNRSEIKSRIKEERKTNMRKQSNSGGSRGLTAKRSYSKLACGLAAMLIAVSAVALSSCNATRTITTKSEYWQKGDTSCVIQTRTIESYDASKKL